MRMSAERLAQIGIGVQFLALIRALAEFQRLRLVRGAALTILTSLHTSRERCWRRSGQPWPVP